MLNTITIMGRLTRRPEKRVTPTGITVTRFSVAVERDFGGEDRITDFIDCVAWRASGDFVERYFDKGDMICVVGSLQSNEWKDRDGNARKSWEINVERAYFCGSKKAAAQDAEFAEADDPDADLPF